MDIKELFGSESKSQVYAHLHELLSKDEMTAVGRQIYNLLLMVFFLFSVYITNSLTVIVDEIPVLTIL